MHSQLQSWNIEKKNTEIEKLCKTITVNIF